MLWISRDSKFAGIIGRKKGIARKKVANIDNFNKKYINNKINVIKVIVIHEES